LAALLKSSSLSLAPARRGPGKVKEKVRAFLPHYSPACGFAKCPSDESHLDISIVHFLCQMPKLAAPAYSQILGRLLSDGHGCAYASTLFCRSRHLELSVLFPPLSRLPASSVDTTRFCISNESSAGLTEPFTSQTHRFMKLVYE